MKKIFLSLVCCIVSCLSAYAAIEEHIQFSIYHNSSDASNQFRIRMRTDTSSYWDGTAHTLTLYQVPIRFADADSLLFTVSNSGLPFVSGNLALLPVVNDPTDPAYSLRRLYYDGGSSSPSGGSWAMNTEYDLAILTITAGTLSSGIQLPNDTTHNSGIYTYTEFNGSDYMTNYTYPFYGDTLSESGWDYASLSGSPLPVSLAGFTAYAENETDARLTWQAATEENNRGFYVERSVDGKSWDVITFTPTLAPGGNSDVIVDYQYTDMNVYKSWNGISTYYYRLRQQDMNGEEEYVGGIKAVRFNGEGMSTIVSAYPNPASNMITIEAKEGSPFRYDMVDMSGRIVQRGNYQSRLNISGLRAGVYQLMVFDITGAKLGAQNISVVR
jgi:hypothetical protein